MMRLVKPRAPVLLGIALVVSLIWVGLRLTVLSEVGRDESAKSDPLATLRALEGSVEVSPPSGAFVDVEASAGLQPGSRVRTGADALAEVEYFDGSLSRIGPDTTYEIVELEQGPARTVIVGKLGLGETFHVVKELTGSGSRFAVEESNAIAVVRGTRFAARCQPPLPCGIAVVEGVVEVTPSSGEPVAVKAGQRVTIEEDGTVGALARVSPEDPWLNRNRDLDEPAREA